MESPQLVLCNKTQRVTIFKIPPLSTSKGYYLDDWKEMIWEGGVKVTEKNKIIKIAFIDKHGKIFGETKVPSNYKEAIVKTNDSSRGYAVRLENPKGGYIWVGVAFRDRNDAFDFGVVFQDEANRNKINTNSLNEQFGQKVDFSLKKGEKVKISINSQAKKEKKQQQNPGKNPFAFDFDFTPSVSTSHQAQKIQKPKQEMTNDWANFDFDSKPSNSSAKPVQKIKNDNLLDF